MQAAGRLGVRKRMGCQILEDPDKGTSAVRPDGVRRRREGRPAGAEVGRVGVAVRRG